MPNTIIGKIAHRALEEFANALQQAGNPDPDSDYFQRARQAFPIRPVVRKLRQMELDSLKNNPRANIATLAELISVDTCINIFKTLLQDGIALKATITSAPPGFNISLEQRKKAFHSKETPLGFVPIPVPAILPEVSVSLSDPPIRGRLDLVITSLSGDVIVEYKTGEPSEKHDSQSRFYALLWFLKTGRIIVHRQLLYAGHDPVDLPGLDRANLEIELANTIERIQRAQDQLSHQPAIACSSADTCPVCPVRHLCDVYWQSPTTAGNRWSLQDTYLLGTDSDVAWRDLEIELTNPRVDGQGFTFITQSKQDKSDNDGVVRVFCPIPTQFDPGSVEEFKRVRLLGVSLQKRGNEVRVLVSRSSEFFWFNT